MLADGSDGVVVVELVVCDIQTPTSDVELAVVVVPDAGVAVELLELVFDGANTLVACSKPHAPEITDTASAAQSDKLRFIVTNLSVKNRVTAC